MTKKDFLLIANAMASQRPGYQAHSAINQWTCDCEALAMALSTTNALFNRTLFLKTCNGGN